MENVFSIGMLMFFSLKNTAFKILILICVKEINLHYFWFNALKF